MVGGRRVLLSIAALALDTALGGSFSPIPPASHEALLTVCHRSAQI